MGVAGCTVSFACNYNPEAEYDDASCSYIPAGDCDCDGNVLDECGTCGGDNSTCLDCCGVVNGDGTTCEGDVAHVADQVSQPVIVIATETYSMSVERVADQVSQMENVTATGTY